MGCYAGRFRLFPSSTFSAGSLGSMLTALTELEKKSFVSMCEFVRIFVHFLPCIFFLTDIIFP